MQTPPPPAAFLRRPCASSLRAHGVPVALWETSLRCYCAVTATPRRSYGAHTDRSGNAEPRRALCACPKCAPWHGVLEDPTASSGDVTAMPRWFHGALGDSTARTLAFWNFLGRCAIAVRTPPWCDRGFNPVDPTACHLPECVLIYRHKHWQTSTILWRMHNPVRHPMIRQRIELKGTESIDTSRDSTCDD